MFIQATTIKIPSEEVNSNDTNSKLGSLSLKDKMADTLSTFMSELVISIVVAIFTQNRYPSNCFLITQCSTPKGHHPSYKTFYLNYLHSFKTRK
jgi:hypothetical protein